MTAVDSDDWGDWDPMAEDYWSVTFNSYSSGQIGGHLPIQLLQNRAALRQNSSADSVETESLHLFVDGFPSDLTEAGLKNFLERIGCRVSSIKVLRRRAKSGNRTKPMAFVEFESAKEANRAVQLISGQQTFKLLAFFVNTETEAQIREQIMDKEFEEFAHKLYKQNREMRINGEIDPKEEPKVLVRNKNPRFRSKSEEHN